MLTYHQTVSPVVVAAGRPAHPTAISTAIRSAVATPAELDGFNRLSLTLVALQLATVALLAALYARSSLTIAWSTQ
jgi:hypothetical protein